MAVPTLVSIAVLQGGRVIRTVWSEAVTHAVGSFNLSISRGAGSSTLNSATYSTGDSAATVDWTLASLVLDLDQPTATLSAGLVTSVSTTQNNGQVTPTIANWSQASGTARTSAPRRHARQGRAS